MTPRALALGGAVAASLAAGPVVRGNPIDAYAFGARAAAMAGAHTAAATDGSAGYYNPALLAWFDGVRIDLGYQAAMPSLALDGYDSNVDPSRGLTLALSSPGHLGPIDLALGAALFLPDHQLTRLRYLEAGQPRFVLFDNRPQRLLLVVSAAARVGERVAIGGGLGYMADTSGGVALEGRLGFPDAEASDLALGVDVDLPAITYPQAGVGVRVSDWLTVGASYRGGFDTDADLTISLDGEIGAEGRDPIVEHASLDVQSLTKDRFQPTQWSAGLWATLTSRLAIAIDATYARWSTLRNPASRIHVQLDAGQFDELFDLPDPPPLAAPNFHDILIPRLGVEYTLRGDHRALALRAGYAYEPSPAPEQIGGENFADGDKHTLATGVGLTVSRWSSIVRGPASLDGFVSFTALEPRANRKLSAIDPVGDYTASGHIVALGLSSSWRF